MPTIPFGFMRVHQNKSRLGQLPTYIPPYYIYNSYSPWLLNFPRYPHGQPSKGGCIVRPIPFFFRWRISWGSKWLHFLVLHIMWVRIESSCARSVSTGIRLNWTTTKGPASQTHINFSGRLDRGEELKYGSVQQRLVSLSRDVAANTGSLSSPTPSLARSSEVS